MARTPFGMEWNSSDRDYRRFLQSISVISKRIAQLGHGWDMVAAEIIAEKYRRFLSAGRGRKRSEFTTLLHGDDLPLRRLAKHVIARPSRGTRGATVTFEHRWSKKAQLLHTGYFIVVTRRMRQALFASILAKTGKTNIRQVGQLNRLGQGDSTRWEVPARPHLDFLKRPEHTRTMEAVYMHAVHGKPLPRSIKSRTK